MTKEVIIDLKESANGFVFLVQKLSQILKLIPLSNAQRTQLTFLITEEMTDEKIKGIIEPCIGAFVSKITINEKK